MRHWLFHPVVFYPLALALAALFVAISLKPQAWPRDPAPVAGAPADGGLVLEGAGLGAPEGVDAQRLFVERDFLGQAQKLRIAIEPGQTTTPGPADSGVRILLAPEATAQLPRGPLLIEVRYNPMPVNAASGLAVRLEGPQTSAWVIQDLQPSPETARFALPPAPGATALALRAVSRGADQAYGVEITRIRILPHPGAIRAN